MTTDATMTTRATWLSIAERCEAAKGADREIDAAIMRALSGSREHWHEVAGTFMTDDTCPHVTASIDAITALIERELPDSLPMSRKTSAMSYDAVLQPASRWVVTARTEPLARAAALARAMAARAGG